MRLMEDLATIPLNQQVIVQPSSGLPPLPTNVPLATELPQQKRHFKQRSYSTLGDPKHKLELKLALINRIQDPELKEQFEQEIKALQKQIKENETNRTNQIKGD